MDKIDWKRKLSSRKFWMAAIGFVSAVMTASGATEGTITQVTAVIMSGAVLIAYIIAEGFADAEATNVTNTIELTESELKALVDKLKDGE